jgi:hypothetical protein
MLSRRRGSQLFQFPPLQSSFRRVHRILTLFTYALHVSAEVFIFMQCEGFRSMGFLSLDDVTFRKFILSKSQHSPLAQRDRRPRSVVHALALLELWSCIKERKKFWLLPIILCLVMLGSLIVFTSGSAVAPFIYTLE